MHRKVSAYTRASGPARPWTQEEVEWLTANCHLLQFSEIFAHFPYRSTMSVRHRMLSLKLRPSRVAIKRDGGLYKIWTEQDFALLKNQAGQIPATEIARLTGRSLRAVKSKAQMHGISLAYHLHTWSEKDLNYLHWNVGTSTLDELTEGSGRPRNSVKQKLYDLGLKPLSEKYTLTRAVEETGYDYTQLRSAKKALGQTWRRARHHATFRYVISDDQLEDCCEWLKGALKDRTRLPSMKSIKRKYTKKGTNEHDSDNRAA
jgi:hypothetical protein